MKRRLAVLLSLAAACTSSPSGPTTITGITPADGATKVSAYTTVTIQLSGGDPDPSSVNATTVRLYHGASKNAVSGAVAYDADAQTITFTPNVPLAQTVAGNSQLPTFRVDVNGVTAGGAAVPEKTTTFAIYADPLKSNVNVYPKGQAQFSDAYTHDANGNVTGFVSHGPGPDGTFGTADDVVRHYWVDDPAANGHKQARDYSDAGPDGQWQTADDVMDEWCDTTLGVGGDPSYVCYGDPGADGKWFTADDVVAFYTLQTFDDQDRATKVVVGDAGVDNVIGNADDDTQFYFTYAYDGIHDQPSVTGSATDPGPDGKWFTPDDEPADQIASFNDKGQVTGWIIVQPGPDGTLGTADDNPYGSTTVTLDAHGAIVAMQDNSEPGPDGKWGTADDVASDYYKNTYDANGVMTESDQWDIGADFIPFNADDFLQDALSYDDSL